jgi:hypothetical protein
MSDDRTDEPIDPLEGASHDERIAAFENDPWVRDRVAEMKQRDAQEVPTWFLPVLAAALVWVGIGIWLMHKLHWPTAYGFSEYCGVRGCIFLDIIRSPALLRNPTGTSLALFAWYMSAVAILLAIVVHAASTKPRGQYLMLLALIAGGFVVLVMSPDGKAGW